MVRVDREARLVTIDLHHPGGEDGVEPVELEAAQLDDLPECEGPVHLVGDGGHLERGVAASFASVDGLEGLEGRSDGLGAIEGHPVGVLVAGRGRDVPVSEVGGPDLDPEIGIEDGIEGVVAEGVEVARTAILGSEPSGPRDPLVGVPPHERLVRIVGHGPECGLDVGGEPTLE
ncbi:MAG: hypothetical protein QF911_05390 [Candidatus Thalassarchaeaceae archaeon]|nr:hypothetical protein [Candidatus Thalassarchaeaceae archaeon]